LAEATLNEYSDLPKPSEAGKGTGSRDMYGLMVDILNRALK